MVKASDFLYYTLASFSMPGELGLPRVSCPQWFGGRWGLAFRWANPWTTKVQQGATGAGVTCGITGEPNPQQQTGRKKRDRGGEECYMAWVRKNVYNNSQIGLLFYFSHDTHLLFHFECCIMSALFYSNMDWLSNHSYQSTGSLDSLPFYTFTNPHAFIHK